MSENINFTSNFTLTKLVGNDVNKILFDITPTDGLIISKDILGGGPITTTIDGDLVVTGDLNVIGNSVINTDTKLSLTNKNVLMNVPSEPAQPSGTSTLLVDAVSFASVTDPGVAFTPLTAVPVTFTAPPVGVTAVGYVTSDGSGNVPFGTVVTVTNSGSGYVVPPTFTFGTIANIPPRPTVVEDAAGTIVIRDWFDGTQPHVGILWNETDYAWDLNKGIPQDIYTTNVDPTTVLPTNPRITNLGDADLNNNYDAVNVNTLKSWNLSDLNDAYVNSPSIGEVLIYKYNPLSLQNEWLNSQISFGDITGITLPPSTSGYFFWDHTLPAVDFVSTIPETNITGLSVVAKDGQGDIRYLGDVNLPAAPLVSVPNGINNLLVDGDVLAWDYITGKWVNKQVGSLGAISGIQDDPLTPTSYVNATTTGIDIVTSSGDINITSTNDSVNINSAISIVLTSNEIELISQNPILVATDSAPNRNAILTSEGDFTLMSSTGSIILQDITFPGVDSSTPVDSVLVLKKANPLDGEGWLEWEIPATVITPDKIQNDPTLPTAYVSTSNSPDTIMIMAPDLGSIGVDTITPVTNNIGVYIQPGASRSVTIAGTGDSEINSTEGMNISASNTLTITSGNDVRIQDYEFPSQLTSRLAGDFLVLDPNDVTKKQLIFKTVKELPADQDGYLKNTSGTLSWESVISPLAGVVNISVGPTISDDYTTINAALDFVTSTYLPVYYSGTIKRVNIILSAGYNMSEQVLVDSINLGWVTITGSNSPYTVFPSSFNALSATVYKPAFAAFNGGRLPVIDVIFEMDTVPMSFQVGIMTMGACSSADVTPSGGFNGFYINAYALNCSSLNMDGATLSSGLVATEYGVLSENSSTVSAKGCDISSCEYGVAAINGSRVDCSGSNVTAASQFGVLSAKGSYVTAIDTDARKVVLVDGDHDFVVQYGSIISANDGLGGTGQYDGNVTTPITTNNNSTNGIIYK